METFLRLILAAAFVLNGLFCLGFWVDFTSEVVGSKVIWRERNWLISAIVLIAGVGLCSLAIRVVEGI